MLQSSLFSCLEITRYSCETLSNGIFADVCLTCLKITQKRVDMIRYGIIDYVMSNFLFLSLSWQSQTLRFSILDHGTWNKFKTNVPE